MNPYSQLDARDASHGPLNVKTFGWLNTALTKLAESRSHVLSVAPYCDVVPTQAYPLQLIPQTREALVLACKQAVLGSAVKAYGLTAVASTPVDITIDLGAVPSFGVHARISASLLNQQPGTFTCQTLDGSTVISEYYVLVAPGQVVDVISLGISSAGGQASVTRLANPKFKVIAATSQLTGGSQAVFAETLNIRDLGSIGIN